MSLMTYENLIEEEIKDLYSAENQLLQALPKMQAAAHCEELKQAFAEHLEETHTQVDRLTQAARLLGIGVTGETCNAMKGLIEEAEELIQTPGLPEVKDAALVGAAQRVEHYEIAAYGTVCQLLKNIEGDEAKDLLGKTLDEEKAADKTLSKLATGGLFSSGINHEAKEG
ncbi:ferritin-like domain-containing protein [Kiritimatiellaeota bacterium B1221]|nr:ferritin-like domain-containing protein [Kiritimatiellaeota bacterium B1221]